jgi:hypothetical protein
MTRPPQQLPCPTQHYHALTSRICACKWSSWKKGKNTSRHTSWSGLIVISTTYQQETSVDLQFPLGLQVKFAEDMAEAEAQLRPSQAAKSYHISFGSHLKLPRSTYLIPRHIRGPREKATSHLSKSADSSSQRSGTNSSGFGKISALKWTNVLPHDTMV